MPVPMMNHNIDNNNINFNSKTDHHSEHLGNARNLSHSQNN